MGFGGLMGLLMLGGFGGEEVRLIVFCFFIFGRFRKIIRGYFIRNFFDSGRNVVIVKKIEIL